MQVVDKDETSQVCFTGNPPLPKNNSWQCKINLRFLYWSGTETCNEIYSKKITVTNNFYMSLYVFVVGYTVDCLTFYFQSIIKIRKAC